MKTYLTVFLAAVLIIAVFASCADKDTNEPTDIEAKEFTINAVSYDQWMYFSFETGDTFRLEDPYNSDAWDLAFQRYHLKTNSGTSGKGMGGAISKGKVAFESITTADDSGYITDDSLKILKMGGDVFITANHELAKWGALDTTAMPPVFVPADNIMIVKSAKGKYAKVWLKSFYSNEGASGFVRMKYLYQPDGSKKLSE